MLDVEQAIREVGAVYQVLTGHPIEAGRSDLPPESDPRAHIEGRYRQFKTILESPPRAAAAAPLAPLWTPRLEVVELEHEVRFALELPAVPRDQVSVALVSGYLLVRGSREGAPAPGAAVRYSERAAGPFQRLIALPERARRDGVHASLRDGVLSITVPTDGPAVIAQPVEIK
jgi:HSP20 family molecular chaperone IbpA